MPGDPFKRSAESQALLTKTEKIRDLYAGTERMRDQEKTYLPQEEAESTGSYKNRLSRSFLFNGIRKTVRDMSSRVFDKPVVLDKSVPPKIVEWADNIDLEGSKLTVFSQHVFEEALQPGITWIMVDAPQRDGRLSLADTSLLNLRPRMIHVSINELLGWKIKNIANVAVVTQVRILESASKEIQDNPYEDEMELHVRVHTLTDEGVLVEVFRKAEGGVEQVEDPHLTGLDKITIVPVYANKTRFFIGEPLLEDLADDNIRHWQSQSDQCNILHVARVPILHAAGFAQEDKIIISSARAVVSSDPASSLNWAELHGNSIGVGRQDIKDIEFQMQAHGLQLLVDRNASTGASDSDARADDEKSKSTIATIANGLEDALETALGWMAEYAGTGEDGGTVTVNKSYGLGELTQGELTFLLQAVTTGQISHETFIKTLVSRGFLSENVTSDDELERVEDEDTVDADELADAA